MAITVVTDLSATADTRVLTWVFTGCKQGDLLVVSACSDATANTLTFAINGPAKLFKSGSNVTLNPSYINGYYCTADGNVTITATPSSATADMHGGTGYQLPYADGYSFDTNPNGSITRSTGAPSTTITAGKKTNLIIAMNADNAAVDGTSRTYRTGGGTVVEDGYLLGTMGQYFWHSFITAAGNQIVGLTAPAGQSYTTLSMEIRLGDLPKLTAIPKFPYGMPPLAPFLNLMGMLPNMQVSAAPAVAAPVGPAPATPLKSHSGAFDTGNNAEVSCTTVETIPTAVGDLVIIVQGDDYYLSANVATPTVTGNPTVNAIPGATVGADNSTQLHYFWYVANTAGAQTVTSRHLANKDDDKWLGVTVLDGTLVNTISPIDDAQSVTTIGGTATASLTAPAVTPTLANDYIITAVQNPYASTASATTAPPSLDFSHSESNSGTRASNFGGKQLSASGATGTFAFTLSAGNTSTYVAATIAIQGVAASGGTTQTLTASGIPTAETWGVDSLAPGALAISTSGVSTAEAWGAPASMAGAITVGPSAFGSDESWGSGSLSTGSITVTPTGVVSSESWGTDAISTGAIVVSPTAVTTTEAWGTGSIAVGAITVAPVGVVTAESWGTAAIATGSVAVMPTGIGSVEAWGPPAVVAGGLALTPTGIASNEIFGSATASSGGTILVPTGILTGESFGLASITTGALTVTPTGITSAEVFGSGAVSTGAVALTVVGIASTEAWGTGTLTVGAKLITPVAIASGEAFGLASIVTGPITITPTGIASIQALGLPVLTPSAVILALVGISSAEAFGLASIASGPITVTVVGIGTGFAWGLVTVVPGPISLTPVGIATAEVFGLQRLTPGATRVYAVAVMSGEAFGTPEVDVVAQASYDLIATYFVYSQGVSEQHSTWSDALSVAETTFGIDAEIEV